MRVLFAGGGTGGHLYPALAIARALTAADQRVRPFFIGARRGVERDVLPTTEFPFELLDLHPLYRSRPWLNWRTLAGGAAAWRRIAAIVSAQQPCALVATGGYAAGAALGYASRHRIPIVIQEQNSFPGLTVRWFARKAAQIHLGFPEAADRLRVGPHTEVIASGNPIEPPPSVHQDRAAAAVALGLSAEPLPVLLIFGGSQGAQAINRVVADWLWAGGARECGVRVVWGTGAAGFGTYESLASPTVRVMPYISPMRDAYAAADLALTRAGAMTTAELAAWGLPSVLVPLPTAAADHQTANAQAIAADGAAVVIPQRDLNRTVLAQTIAGLVSQPDRLQDIAASALRRARPHAAHDIAKNILTMQCFK